MSEKSIRKNYLYNLTYQILTLITPFLTTPYVSRVLSPYGVGLQSFAFAVSQNFALFAGMGIGTHGQREVSYAQDDRKERTRIFWELEELSIISTLVWLVIYITLVMVYIKNHYTLFFVLTLNIVGVATGNVVWLFYGMEDFKRIVVRQIIFKILDVIFIFVFIKEESDLALYVFGSVFFSWLISVTLWLDVRDYVDWPDWKNLNPFRDIKIIILLFLPTIAVQIYTILDKVMLGFITEGTAESGYYELALRISKMPVMIVATLSSVMMPRIGHLFKKNDVEAIHDYMYRSFRFAWFISIPLCLGLIAVSDNFVAWFFGDYYGKVAGLLKISSFILIFIALNNITGGQYLIPTGRQNMLTFTLMIGAVSNFTMNLFLIRYYQSYGALVASVIAEALVLLSQLYVLRKDFNVFKILFSSINYVIAGAIMFAVLSSFNKNLPANPLGTFTIIFSGAAIYFGVLLILRDEFFLTNAERVFKGILKKINRR